MSLFRILFFCCISFSVSSNQIINIDEVWESSENYNLIGDRESSINVLLENIEFLNKVESQSVFKLSSVYNYLGLRYQTYGEWDESAFAYIKSIELLKDSDDYDVLKSQVYLNLGLLYLKVANPSANYYLNFAEEIALKEGYSPVLFILYKVTDRLEEGVKFAKYIQNNQYLANYYYLLGNSKDSMSKFYFDSARIVLPKLPDSKLQNFQYHAYVVQYFINNNRLDSALYHCKKAEYIAPLLNDDEVNNHFLSCYANVYLKMGEYKKAWDYKRKADSISSLYKSPKNLAVLEEIDKQRIFFEKENKILQLESEKRIRNLAILVFVLIFIIIYHFVRKENRLNLQLTKSNKTKDRLFSIISHDLRGSIASILLLSQDEKEENFSKIRKGSESLLFEFDNLLNWSLDNQDKIILYPEIIDVNEIVEEEVKLLVNQIFQKNINIINQYEDDYIAFVDENTIRIVLRNILHNAIKFSPNNSEVRIVISEENETTKINIVDCGCGFSTNHNSQGMGLGLELCKEFIEINNGELIISSSESGSSVMVVIPCSKI